MKSVRRPILVLIALILLAAADATLAQRTATPRQLQTARMLRTAGGVEFSFVGAKGGRAPLLVVLGGDRKTTIEREDYNAIGALVAKHGFVQASLDLPCHGDDSRPGEPQGIAGWRARLEKGERLFGTFTARISAIVDYLAQEGDADAARVAVCGSSRGGFSALHAAAAEPRLRYVIAFSPATDLLALREFQGIADPAPARALDAMLLAERLADRNVWISMGHNDERVGSRHAIDFALRLMEISPRRKEAMTHFWSIDDILLTVGPSQGAGGHSTHRNAHEEAAAWLLRRVGH